jgi:heptosyltransferase II
MGKVNLNITPENTQRLLVVLPNWVGDVALATPALRAIREHYPKAHIGYLMRPYVREVLEPCQWCDEVFFFSGSGNKARRQHDYLKLAGEIRKRKFEVAMLFSNSFRAALLAKLAGVKIRIGYTRDGRSMLLTVKMMPDRVKGKYVAAPMVHYYGALARYLGCTVDEDRLELPVRPADQAAADRLLAEQGFGQGQRFIAINPGAAYGSAKCWPPERFAEVAERLTERTGMRSLVVYGPGEQDIARRIVQCAKPDTAVVPPQTVGLGVAKGLMNRASLLVTNDTGPRHFARAFGKPVVTIFGSTDPRWTEMHYPRETKVQVGVPCGPCMLKRCPLDHRCMQLVTADMVCGAAVEALNGVVSGQGPAVTQG